MKKSVTWLLLFLLAFLQPVQAAIVLQNWTSGKELYRQNQATVHYDGNGQRVQKTVNGVAQKFLWNGGSIAKEYKADGTVRADYQLGAGAKIDGKWQFNLSDIQGSTLGVTDDAGKMIATWDYSDYGVTTQTSGDKNLYQPFLYTGQELDAETGFYHNRARHYAPRLGKFLARDSLNNSNRYQYCNGDPINFSDPSGLDDTVIDDQAGQMGGYLAEWSDLTGLEVSVDSQGNLQASGSGVGAGGSPVAQAVLQNMINDKNGRVTLTDKTPGPGGQDPSNPHNHAVNMNVVGKIAAIDPVVGHSTFIHEGAEGWYDSDHANRGGKFAPIVSHIYAVAVENAFFNESNTSYHRDPGLPGCGEIDSQRDSSGMKTATTLDWGAVKIRITGTPNLKAKWSLKRVP